MVNEVAEVSQSRRGLGRGLSALLPQLPENIKRPRCDALTGLPGPDLLVQRIDAALGQARADDADGAVIVLGLTGFRHINRLYGHDVGDALLQQVGARLASRRRAYDELARVGGDEFAVLCLKVGARNNAARLVTRLQREVEEPLAVNGLSHRLTATAGVGWMSASGVRGGGRSLIRQADLAMQWAKDEGMPWALFDPDIHQAPTEAGCVVGLTVQRQH
ncbi:MAG TPA: GGDEF domain-containing protein [Acidimicrobiales bacterium]|nr:GGDEF domain-containing protein [Acidimicrobiales bacterium]